MPNAEKKEEVLNFNMMFLWMGQQPSHVMVESMALSTLKRMMALQCKDS